MPGQPLVVRHPKDHKDIKILQAMVAGIPLVLGLGTRLMSMCPLGAPGRLIPARSGCSQPDGLVVW